MSECWTWLLIPLNKEFFFLLQAISAFLSTKMVDRGFDIQLNTEFSGAATDPSIVEWIENVELVCELYEMKRVERVLPLQLRAGARIVYQQLTREQRSDAEQIKEALITAYATDPSNTFEQFRMWQLRPRKNGGCVFGRTKTFGCCPSGGWYASLFWDCHKKSDSYSRHWPKWTPWSWIKFWLELRWSLMTTNLRSQFPHPLNKLMMMLTHLSSELFTLSALAPTTWPKIVGRVTQRGQLTERRSSTTKYSVLGVTRFDISPQSARKITQGS